MARGPLALSPDPPTWGRLATEVEIGGSRRTARRTRAYVRTGPGPTCVTLDGRTFVAAEVSGDSGLSLEEVQAEEGEDGPQGRRGR